MPAQWTCEIIGKMHMYGISKKQLAQQLGMTPEYTGKVLNGRNTPKNAKNKFTVAVNELINKKGR